MSAQIQKLIFDSARRGWILLALALFLVRWPSAPVSLGQTAANRPLLIGWYSNVEHPERLVEYARNGVNIVLACCTPAYLGQPSVIAGYLDRARDLGVKVILDMRFFNPALSTSQFANGINTFKNHPALYGWYIADEPELATDRTATINAVATYYSLLKANDPGHPGFGVHSGTVSHSFAPLEDLIGVDWYPSARNTEFGGGVPTSYDAWNAGLTAAGTHGKRFVAVAQGFGVNPYESVYKDLTYGELRYHAFSALVQGIDFILFWTDDWTNEHTAALVAKIISQIHAISGAMKNGVTNDARIKVSHSTGDLVFRYGAAGDAKAILAVNIANRSGGGATLSDVRFTLPANQAASHVEVLGESRTIPVTNGAFSDTFNRFEVHIYRLLTRSTTPLRHGRSR